MGLVVPVGRVFLTSPFPPCVRLGGLRFGGERLVRQEKTGWVYGQVARHAR